jgi:hypothetical protein
MTLLYTTLLASGHVLGASLLQQQQRQQQQQQQRRQQQHTRSQPLLSTLLLIRQCHSTRCQPAAAANLRHLTKRALQYIPWHQVPAHSRRCCCSSIRPGATISIFPLCPTLSHQCLDYLWVPLEQQQQPEGLMQLFYQVK